jgi:PPM family protein phosphatase
MATCLRIRPGIDLANSTDIGCTRENNQDYYGYWEPESDEEFHLKGRLAIVADGMGGHEGGQEASRLAVDTMREVYRQSSGESPQQALLAGMQAAHEHIRDYARAHFDSQKMGTTCTALALAGGFLHYAHVGDSRLYLIRDGVINCMTRDDRYVARLVESGTLSAEEAKNHPEGHVLTAALGADNRLEVECTEVPIPITDGDLLVLCTDGLWSIVSNGELLQVATADSPSEACARLIAMTKQRGAPDNVTIQILKVSNIARE